MFTGIVEETGRVQKIEPSAKSIRLTLAAKLTAKNARIGDSLAVNGCCLTIVKISRPGRARHSVRAAARDSTTLLEFDLLRETWERTNFKSVALGSSVNLERSLALGDRLHGHFVTGHIDATGEIVHFEKRGADWLLEIRPPRELLRYIAFKGSIAVDGISLTVASVAKTTFTLWIIPHTYEVTALRERRPGSLVNLETDLLAKYVEKLR